MQTEKTQYKVLKDEFHGLLVIATKDDKSYKLFISNDLLLKNNLTFWADADYYKKFLDQNIESFVESVENGNCRNIYDGFSIGG